MGDRHSVTNRRTMIQLAAAAGIASFAGCTASGLLGDDYEAGDDERAMITVDYFGDGWVEGDDSGEGEEEDEERFESVAGRMFHTEDHDEAVVASIGIAADADAAEEAVDEWSTANIVDGESIDLGDGGERGEADGFGAVVFSHSNAAIFTLAGHLTGPQPQPNHGQAYEIGEDLLENLQSL